MFAPPEPGVCLGELVPAADRRGPAAAARLRVQEGPGALGPQGPPAQGLELQQGAQEQ